MAPRVLLVCNSPRPQVDSVLRLLRQKWPSSSILLLVKEGASLSFKRPGKCHVHLHPSPESFALTWRLARMRFDVVVIRKHELTLKLAASLLFLRPRAFFLLKSWEGEAALHQQERRPLVAWAWEKRRFLWSCVTSSLPLACLGLQLPLVLLRAVPWRAKKELLRTIGANLSQGPFADSPFLFAWLQVAMALAFVFSRRPRHPPQRILLIRIDHIGDNVNTIPLVRQLRSLYPDARISILAATGEFLWKHSKDVDEVLVYGTNNRILNRGKGRLRWTFRPFTYWRVLQSRRFDLVLDPVGRTETHILAFLCSRARRISTSYYPYRLYGMEVPIRHYETLTHETERTLALLTPLFDGKPADRHLESWLTSEHQERAASLLRSLGLGGDDRILGVHPGAMSPLRLWPLNRYAAVVAHISQKHALKPLLFEVPGAQQMTEEFLRAFAALGIEARVFRTTDIDMLTAVLGKCHFLLCADSGPMHLAAAMKTPLVAIFGPGEYWRWKPLHEMSAIVRKPLSCAPCSQNGCNQPECILQVTVEDVVQACDSVLARLSQGRAAEDPSLPSLASPSTASSTSTPRFPRSP